MPGYDIFGNLLNVLSLSEEKDYILVKSVVIGFTRKL